MRAIYDFKEPFLYLDKFFESFQVYAKKKLPELVSFFWFGFGKNNRFVPICKFSRIKADDRNIFCLKGY